MTIGSVIGEAWALYTRFFGRFFLLGLVGWLVQGAGDDVSEDHGAEEHRLGTQEDPHAERVGGALTRRALKCDAFGGAQPFSPGGME